MLTNILAGLLAYSVFLGIFMVGWHRHCVRVAQYDQGMQNPNKV